MKDYEFQATVLGMMKAAQWEKAKGELRALVQMQGSNTFGENTDMESKRWRNADAAVEAFINEFENNALQE